VRVDVVEIAERDAAAFEGPTHEQGGGIARFLRVRDVMGFRTDRPTSELCERDDPSRADRVFALENQECSPFAEPETGAPPIERSASIECNRAERIESREREAAEAVRAARQDPFGTARANPVGGEKHGVGAARTSAANRARASKRSERRLESIGGGAQGVTQHERQGLAAARIPVHLGEHLLGLEHAAGGAADGEVHFVAARIEPRFDERFARRDHGHRVRPGPRVAMRSGRNVSDGQTRDLGCLVGPLIARIEQRHGPKCDRPPHQAVHRRSSPERERRDDPESGDENAHSDGPTLPSRIWRCQLEQGPSPAAPPTLAYGENEGADPTSLAGQTSARSAVAQPVAVASGCERATKSAIAAIEAKIGRTSSPSGSVTR
jgi:hypothetical protein